MKIIIGAGKTSYDGWISTQENELNLIDRKSFERMFSVVRKCRITQVETSKIRVEAMAKKAHIPCRI